MIWFVLWLAALALALAAYLWALGNASSFMCGAALALLLFVCLYAPSANDQRRWSRERRSK